MNEIEILAAGLATYFKWKRCEGISAGRWREIMRQQRIIANLSENTDHECFGWSCGVCNENSKINS